MKIKLIYNNSKIPTKGSKQAAGYDLYSLYDYYVYPHEKTVIKTGVVMEIPTGFYGRIEPRSGLAIRNGIDVLAGIIDSDYRGEISVILYNTDKERTFSIKMGDRIAQIIFEKHYSFDFEVVEKLEESQRGDSGFGSTGV